MLALASRLRPIWPVLALLASGALLAGAHAFQTFGGLLPCPLCLDQRKWHWGVVGVAALAFAVTRFKPGWSRAAAAVIGLVLLGAAGMAAYHVAVEQHWVVAQCDARVNMDELAFDLNAEVRAPACDQIAWSMFGISMAGYNAIISLLLALASFAIAFLPERKS
jgi:disulfide bond formation protein DsbB